jgi:virginiamycin B lyase
VNALYVVRAGGDDGPTVTKTISRRSPALAFRFAVASLAAAALLFYAPRAGAAPVGAVEHFPTKCKVGTLVDGPDGNVWFSCFREGAHPGAGGRAFLGRITPAGKVAEFGVPGHLGIGGIVAGPEGNLWVSLSGGAYPPSKSRPSAIARVAPNGKMTLFRTGLREGSSPGEIVTAPDGALWFADTAYGKPPEVGRITPDGAIAEFPTEVKAPLGLGGIAATPDGSVWFTQVFTLPHGKGEPGGLVGRVGTDGALTSFGSTPAASGAPLTGPDGNVWFVGSTGKTTIDRVTPTGEIAQFDSPLLGLPTDLVDGPDGNIWFTAQQSIGRITPSGEITRFSDCMDYREAFSEASSIVSGPGKELWFTSVTSRMLPSIGEPPTIGRITADGQITQFKAGIEGEPNSIVAGPDGRVWFAGGGEQIERIAPPSAPVNTFIFGPGEATSAGDAQLPVEVPGPGLIELRRLALVTGGGRTVRLPLASPVGATATTCGTTSLKLRLRGAAAKRIRQGGAVELKVRATFTPTGGSPDTVTETVVLRKPPHRR